MQFIRFYLLALVVFFAFDLLWLGVLAKNLYQEQIGFLLKKEINWVAGLLFYALYTESDSKIGKCQGGAPILSQAKPTPKQLNLKDWAMQAGLKSGGCPTPAEPIFESRAVYLFGLVYFAIWPAAKSASMGLAVFNGALFGLICYATYDLTNLATLKGWPVKITAYDMIWGTCLSAITSWICVTVGAKWKCFS